MTTGPTRPYMVEARDIDTPPLRVLWCKRVCTGPCGIAHFGRNSENFS